MPTRRAVLASALAAAAARPTMARAQAGAAPTPTATTGPATALQLERRSIEVNGKPASVFGIRQPDGTYGITTEVGKPFRFRVENKIDQPSLIHWHGLTPPWRHDGVPGISGPPIPPGGSADYDFPLRLISASRRPSRSSRRRGRAAACRTWPVAGHRVITIISISTGSR